MNELPPLPVENYIDDDGLWAERQGPYTADQMRAYAAAAVAAAVPEGWRVVPVEPTQAMMEAGEALPPIIDSDLRLRRLGWSLMACQNRRRYAAMLAAAPEVPR